MAGEDRYGHAKGANGFTLLELVVSCAILVSIFAVAASTLTRVHRVHSESKARSRLLAEGNAILDSLADDFAHAAGTNVWTRIATYGAASEGSASDHAKFGLVRYEEYPRSASRAKYAGTVPFRNLAFAASETGGELRAKRRSPTSAMGGNGDGGTHVEYSLRDDGTASRTNAVTKTGRAIELKPHEYTPTDVPVTYTSSVRTYREEHGHGARTEIVAQPDYTNGNLVVSTVVFTNVFHYCVSNSVARPAAGAWPDEGTATNRLLSAMIATNSVVCFATNETVTVEGGTNIVTSVSTNDYLRSFTYCDFTTNTPRQRISVVDYVWHFFLTNFPPAIATNVLVDVPAGNAVENSYTPASPDGAIPPFTISQTTTNSFLCGVAALDAAFGIESIATSSVSNWPPVAAYDYSRAVMAEARSKTTTSNAMSVVEFGAVLVSSYSVVIPVPADTYPTNSVVEEGFTTNFVDNGYSYDTHVKNVPIVTGGSIEREETEKEGIWLEVGAPYAAKRLSATTNRVNAVHYDAFAPDDLPDETAEGGQGLSMMWGNVQSLTVTLLAFDEDDESLLLKRWNPDTTGDPVCADIHIELLSTADRRKAEGLEGQKKAEFIRNRIVSLDRRVLVGTARRPVR